MKIVENFKGKAIFLFDCSTQFMHELPLVSKPERYGLVYNLIKYYIIILDDVRNKLSEKYFSHKYPELKWK